MYIQEVAHHIKRNPCISHGYFIDKIQVNPKTREIEQITFEDKCPNCKKITFSQTVTIDQLNMLIEQIEECFKTV